VIALAYGGGVIVFARQVKPGTLPIAKASARKLRKAVSAVARLAYDGKTLLVPGIPEAPSHWAALQALLRFKALVEGRLGRKTVQRKLARARVRPSAFRRYGDAA